MDARERAKTFGKSMLVVSDADEIRFDEREDFVGSEALIADDNFVHEWLPFEGFDSLLNVFFWQPPLELGNHRVRSRGHNQVIGLFSCLGEAGAMPFVNAVKCPEEKDRLHNCIKNDGCLAA